MENKPHSSRIAPISIDLMSQEMLEILKKIPGDGLKGKFSPVNVLGTLMYNTDTLPQFLDYWVNAKLKMGFSIREQELIILRMGFLYNCNYVWKHHIPVAVEFGVAMHEIEALKKVPLSPIFNPREEALLVLTDSLVNERNISDDLWDKYQDKLSDSEKIDLITIVSQYVVFALVNNVMRVEIESNLDEFPSL